MVFFKRRKERRHLDTIAHKLYSGMVEQSRQPIFYTDHGVPDTLDGRFDMLSLHMSLLVRRLGSIDLTQALVDMMFADMDVNLRETGVSDLAIGRRVRKLAEAFYGRLHAYADALDRSDLPAMKQALCRNLYRQDTHASAGAIAEYAFGLAHQLAAISTQSFLNGEMDIDRP